MFSIIKTLLSRTPCSTELTGVVPAVPTGYFLPQKAEQLTTLPPRKNCLRKIWENCSLSADVYQQFYRKPVYDLLERVQNVPAATDGKWSRTGSFVDLTLQFTTCAVRLSRGYLFPPGASPEEQAEQSVMWNAVIFWSALFHHLPLLAALEGETMNGVSWQPGLSVPESPYCFRFRREPPDDGEASALAALAAGQMMPAAAVNWLSGNNQALRNLAGALWFNNQPEILLIRNIFKKASEIVGSPMSAPVINTSDPQLAVQSPDKVINENTQKDMVADVLTLESALSDKEKVKTEEETEKEQVMENADTDVLLSFFKYTEELISDPAPAPSEKINAPGGSVHTQPEQLCAGEGEKFLDWLRTATETGAMNVNGADDKLHVVAGYIFLPVPEIFFDYLESTGGDAGNRSREALQMSFEDLNVYKRREEKRFYFGSLYDNADRTGKFKRVKGYLIKEQLIFNKAHGDSQYLSLSRNR